MISQLGIPPSPQTTKPAALQHASPAPSAASVDAKSSLQLAHAPAEIAEQPKPDASDKTRENALPGAKLKTDYDFDDNGGLRSIKFVDASTKEVVRQIPSEEVLKMRQRIDEFLENSKLSKAGTVPKSPAGLLLDKKA